MNGEAIFFKLFEAGSRIDLNLACTQVDVIKQMPSTASRDTDYHISMPQPLFVQIDEFNPVVENFSVVTLDAKLYEDGVITFIARLQFAGFPLEDFDTIKDVKLTTSYGALDIWAYMDAEFKEMHDTLKGCIEKGLYTFDPPEEETYNAYCIWDDVGTPETFVKENDRLIAALLIEENKNLRLHDKQIKETLDKSFSFHENDMVIFDIDRCLILDPARDYEDIMLVTELANYELLELRTLDKILDKRLDIAEDDMRVLLSKRRFSRRRIGSKVNELTRLRVDMTFLLENIENSSKIVGDYYLAGIYKHIGDLFRLDEWSKSVRNRLETLRDIYSTAKADTNENLLLWTEIILAVVFVVEFLITLVQLFPTR
jgi:hypothetical protein